jgi:hypothetical protein
MTVNGHCAEYSKVTITYVLRLQLKKNGLMTFEWA